MSEETRNESSEAEVRIGDLLLSSFEVFAGYAWQRLGLIPNPVTGQVEEDLGEARTAIDVCGRLIEFLEPHLDDESRRRVHSALSDLRIQYVKKMGAGGG
ncbi:MAG: hypothetical protein KatS3mg015_1190 [Fimbriimonadales bacterium]|nr:MAG: hypothetical protein KatS3mg015_1190 [Fimbriimonadales bacterium]